MVLSNGTNTQEYLGQNKQSIFSYKHENALESMEFLTLLDLPYAMIEPIISLSPLDSCTCDFEYAC